MFLFSIFNGFEKYFNLLWAQGGYGFRIYAPLPVKPGFWPDSSRTNLLFLAEAGFMRVSILILCRYELRIARCDRCDGIASPQLPSDGRSPAARSTFLAGEERAPRSQKSYFLLKYIFFWQQPEAILFDPTSLG